MGGGCGHPHADEAGPNAKAALWVTFTVIWLLVAAVFAVAVYFVVVFLACEKMGASWIECELRCLRGKSNEVVCRQFKNRKEGSGG